jgi:hypothetical protein
MAAAAGPVKRWRWLWRLCYDAAMADAVKNDARAQKLAAALRANLKRRKELARAPGSAIRPEDDQHPAGADAGKPV